MFFFYLSKRLKKGLETTIILLFLLLLTVMMILHPQSIFFAAQRGIELWWNAVLPSLFPFFVILELLFSFGVTRFLGVLLEPIMRPLFKLPGAASFALIAGFTSGSPSGGIFTASLYQEGQLQRGEAARLLAFANNASPLFILGSVTIGFLEQPQLGWLLVYSHYVANLLIGFLLRFFLPEGRITIKDYTIKSLFPQALKKMYYTYYKNPKPVGSLLGEAARASIEKILLIGGFVVIFSVLLEILSILGVLDFLAKIISFFLIIFGFDIQLALPLASGLIEMTIGIKMITVSKAPLFQQLLCISFILGWAGLAIHAQVAAFTSNNQIPLAIFFLARLLQGVLAAFLTALAFQRIPVLKKHYLNPSFWENTITFNKLAFIIMLLIIGIPIIKNRLTRDKC